VQQLIGNVWEWTVDALVIEDDEEPTAEPVVRKMRSLRGGAFDTYLDCQATCHFQSGDDVLARKHNIGFRTAIGLCDLAGFAGAEQDESPETVEPSLVETQP
jgi:iron(II)-dependent oxidoreductase